MSESAKALQLALDDAIIGELTENGSLGGSTQFKGLKPSFAAVDAFVVL
jgi:hypothetical protein